MHKIVICLGYKDNYMIQDKVELVAEKKVWEVPSLNTLQITQTFGGSGDPEKLGYSGPDT